jgi:C4-dicarboxylate-specific signal transduction histidine kinase
VPRVTANDVRLIQVFSNLITNAADAMSDAKTDNVLCVTTRTGSGGRAVVEIQGTGTGISREHLQRVFDPVFTTKANGLGLGLAICERIVLSVGGEIDVESRPGEGTLFRIALPPEPPAPARKARPNDA